MRLRTGKIRFLYAFFLLFFGVVFIWGVKVFPSTTLAGRIKHVVENEMSRFLSAEVQIKEVGLFFFSPELREVEIRTAGGKPVLTAAKIRVGLDWFKLVTTRSFNKGLRNLDLMTTTVWLWETLNLFRFDSSGGGGGVLPITIGLYDCRLIMEEPGRKWDWGNFAQLSGYVDLRGFPQIRATAEGKSTLDPEAAAVVELAYAVQRKQGKLKIKAEAASAPLWGEKIFRLLRYDRECRVVAGKVSSEVALLLQNGMVRLDEAQMAFADSRWELTALPYPLEDLNAELAVSSTGISVQNFKGKYHDGRISLKGNLETTSLDLDVNLYATGLDPADWATVIPQLKTVGLAGLVDLNLQIGGKLNAPELTGEVRMTDGRLAIAGSSAALDELRLLARLAGDEFHLSYLQGRIGGAPFFLHGRVFNFSDPALDLKGEIKDFPLDILAFEEFPLTGGGVDATFQVRGRLAAPEIKGDLTGRHLQVAGTSVPSLKLSGVYHWAKDHLQINRLTVQALGGQAVIRGELAQLTSAPILQLDVQAQQVALHQLPSSLWGEKIPALTGTADLDLILNGQLSRLVGEAELVVTAGSVDRFSYDQLQLVLRSDGDRLVVRAVLKENDGNLIATGSLQADTGDFRGDLLLHGFKPDDRLLPHPFAVFNGDINGLLQVEGNWTDGRRIQGEGWLEIYDLTYNGQELGVLKLKGKAENGRLSLSDSFLLTPAGEIKLTGLVEWQDQPFYALDANGEDLSLEDLGSLFPDFSLATLAGLTDLRLKITGWEDPLISGEVTSAWLGLNGYYFGDGAVAFRWQEGELSLDRLLLGSAAVGLQGQGKIGADRQLDLDVAVRNFPLVALDKLFGDYLQNPELLKKISGTLTGQGKLQGTIEEPVFAGELSVTEPVFAGFALDWLGGELSWFDRRLSCERLRLRRGEEEVTVYGQVDWTNGAPYLDLGLKMEKAGLADLLLVVGRAPNLRLDADLTGYLRLFGPLAQPQIRLITQIENGELNGYTPLSGELDLQIHDSKVTVNRLLLDDGSGELFASIVYTPGVQLDINARTKDFSLKPLVALTGRADLPTEGRFDLEMMVTTTDDGMQGEFEAFLQDIVWGSIAVNSLGLCGRINDDLVFLEAQDLGTQRLSIQGSIPLNPEWFGGLQLPTAWPHRFSQIDLGLSAEKMEASVLNTFLTGTRFTGGTIDGLISLNGTWRKPYLVGQMEIAGGRGTIAGLSQELKDLNGLLSFSSRGLELRGLSNREGSYLEGRLGRGRFRLGGRVMMDGLRLEGFALRLNGDNLLLSPSFFDGLVGGELTLAGPATQPTLQGKVAIRKARIELPEAKGNTVPFDLNLDLQCEALNDVYFRMYGMAYVPFNGRLHVGGTLRKPELNGELVSNRGWVNVLGDTFRIKSLRAEFRPDYKLYPYLELEATRFLAGTEISLSTAGWSGDLDSLVINPSSNPPMSREEILKLLNWPEKIEDGSLTFANLFQENINMVGDFFIGRVLDEFRSIMPIDFLTLEQDRQEGTFWMNMGKSISEDLYLSYSRNLTSLDEQVWNLEWKIVPNFSLLGDYSAAEGLRWQFQYNLRF
ncbi:MAG TPA: hypothetical protein GXX33_05990 [Firmicutes bacterium]|nr:hypothetical protein [Bacillota bacterium]